MQEMGGPCDYGVSPRSKSFFFSFFGGLLFNLGACWDQDLDQGLTICSLILSLDMRHIPPLHKICNDPHFHILELFYNSGFYLKNSLKVINKAVLLYLQLEKKVLYCCWFIVDITPGEMKPISLMGSLKYTLMLLIFLRSMKVLFKPIPNSAGFKLSFPSIL